MINSMIVDHGSSPKLEDIDGPKTAKEALHRMVIIPFKRRDLFGGIRKQTKGLLLFGPPGTETTMAMLAKAAASESEATFFHVSASSLTSELYGEGPKFVRTLFEVALFRSPSVIFIDEIDSFLSASLASENEAIRVLKTQSIIICYAILFSYAIAGATNKPQDLDAGVLRRLESRIYIPLPDADSRTLFFKKRLIGPEFYLPDSDIDKLVKETRGYSGNELDYLCTEASMKPITELRKLGKDWRTVLKNEVRGLKYEDFQLAMHVIRPSLGERDWEELEQWNRKFGCTPTN
ncbi:hypothetical protein ACJIZ3_003429 [Penstemon smallii]|uniref:microtubule-severing ATPase n=1 Tax=Penstemon smallii TaxID=265156 RepID=A0ABD3UAT0_9LAMI